MLRTGLILLGFVSLALSEQCVRYTFEEGFTNVFSKEKDTCSFAGVSEWYYKDYTDIMIDNHPDRSTKFISPQASSSCASTFEFSMSAGGTVEVNVYMGSEENADQITVLGHQVVSGGNDAVVGIAGASPLQPDFTPGWQTLRFTLGGTGTYNGYITILGTALSSSVVLVDSFRYLPPGTAESECLLYPLVAREVTQSESAEEIEVNEDTFWTALNITIVVLVLVSVLVLLGILCFCCCRKPRVTVAVAA